MSLPVEKTDRGLMRAMFGTISPRYDFITRAFSYGMDRRWKRQAVRSAALRPGAAVLDLACGTGDFSLLALQRDALARPVALDLTEEMLRRALRQGVKRAVCGDACSLPFRGEAFDCVFIGYGVRNFPDLRGALAEVRRVLRPGGMVVTVDFFLPSATLFRRLYLGYLYVQGAFWGLLLHGKPRIYTYIPDSLRSFLSVEGFSAALAEAGFGEVRSRRYIFGGIGVHRAARQEGKPLSASAEG